MGFPRRLSRSCLVLAAAVALAGCSGGASQGEEQSTLPPTATEAAAAGPCAGAISWHEARDHAGERATVAGPVAETFYDAASNGQPTFLNLGTGYPDPDRVTVLIWGDDRGTFPDPPETAYAGKTICVSGEIELSEGVPAIQVSSPSQIALPATEAPATGSCAGAISWHEARDHAGERATVAGPVAETFYDAASNGQPTFLNLGAGYPDPDRVTVLIWGDDRGEFPDPPETAYAGKTICVIGEIELSQGVAEIVVFTPAQIVVAG